ncbi:hypothetical protein KCTC52924_00874 [Arenibacter antarcticus]
MAFENGQVFLVSSCPFVIFPLSGVIFHSDRGSQNASSTFTDILKRYNGSIKQSMSRKGNCWDNAVAESFFKSLKVEWVYAHSYNLKSEAELSVFQWIETWYKEEKCRVLPL